MNLSVRKDSKVTKVLSYTGVMHLFFNPDLYLGSEKALAEIFDRYKDCPEQQDAEARKLAPFSYGLIVFDFDRKIVFDMQSAACPNMFSATTPGEAFFHLDRLREMRWLGEGLYDLYSGKLVVPFSEHSLSNDTSLKPWLEAEYAKVMSGVNTKGELRIGSFPLLSFKVHPPGWKFITFERYDAALFRDALLDQGFLFSDDEKEIWDAWIKQNPYEEF